MLFDEPRDHLGGLVGDLDAVDHRVVSLPDLKQAGARSARARRGDQKNPSALVE